jgi:amino acid transporter
VLALVHPRRLLLPPQLDLLGQLPYRGADPVTAVLLFEVIDTTALMTAAFVATVVVYTLVLTAAWAWRAVRRRSTGSLADEQAPQAPKSTPTPQRRTAPAWAHAEHEEAA